MPPDDKMPPQPKTIELPAMTDRALLEDLTKVVKAGFTQVENRLDTMETNLELLKDDGRDTKARIIRLEGWKEGVDERINRHSGGTRQLSQNDGKQDAAIANVITRLDRVETQVTSIETKTDRQTAILERLNDVAANPMVRRVAYAVGGAVLAYLTARGWLPK